MQPSKPKRKFERLVEVVTTKTKRVKQQATRLGKRQKTNCWQLLSLVKEEGEEEKNQIEKVTTSNQSVGKA